MITAQQQFNNRYTMVQRPVDLNQNCYKRNNSDSGIHKYIDLICKILFVMKNNLNCESELSTDFISVLRQQFWNAMSHDMSGTFCTDRE